MYQFIRAVLMAKGKNKTWVDTNISTVTLSSLYANYLDGYIVLRHTSSGLTDLFLDYKTLKNLDIKFINLTFETWLLTLAPNSLPTILVEPVITHSNILFSDAYQSRFNAKMDGSDIILSKDNIDTNHLQNRVLTSVNGVLHPNIAEGEEQLRIKYNLGTPPKIRKTIGLYSFVDIGDVEQHPITKSMIYNSNSGTKKYESVVIKTNLNITGKSILLSIGGFIHISDGVFDVINENPCTILVRTNRLNILERLFILRKEVSIDSLGLTRSSKAPDAIVVSEINTDAFIDNYLSMLQSFIVVVDTPNLYTERKHVINTKLPGFYESLIEPIFPLIGTNGKEMTYWRRREVDRWVMDVHCDLKPEYLMHTTGYEENNGVNETMSEYQSKNLDAYLLGIYGARKTG